MQIRLCLNENSGFVYSWLFIGFDGHGYSHGKPWKCDIIRC